MFPSSGYFKDAPCPFYDYGLCHRPYCHYKHVIKRDAVSLATPIITPSSVNQSTPSTDLTPHNDTIVEDQSVSPASVTTPTEYPSIQDIFGLSSSDSGDNDIHEPINEPSCGQQQDDEVDLMGNEVGPLDDKVSLMDDEVNLVGDEVNLMDDEVNLMDDEVGPMDDEVTPMDDLQLVQEKFILATKNEQQQNNAMEEMKKSVTSCHDNKGIKRIRKAHINDKVIRDPSAVVVTSTLRSQITTDVKLKEALMDPNAVYSGKKRKAHQTVTEVKKGTQNRPKLQITINAKISTKLRQQFLDSFIDEFIRMGMEPSESYSKALEKEKRLFRKCSSRMTYKSNSTSELVSLRKMVDQELKERKDRSDKRVKELLDMPTLPLVKGTQDSLNSKKKVEHSKHKMAAAGLSHTKPTVVKNPKLISIKTLLNASNKATVSSTTSIASTSKETVSSNKIIPLKFYSSKGSKNIDDEFDGLDCDEVGSSSRGEKRERETELVTVGKSSKKMKKEKSFEAALMANSSKRKKNKQINPTRERGNEGNKIYPLSDVIAPLSPTTPILSETSELCGTSDIGVGSGADFISEEMGSGSHDVFSLHDTPSNDSLINLSTLRRTNNINKDIKKYRRTIDKVPVKPRPLPTYSILSKKEHEFNAEVFYSKLQKYLMTEEQLINNGYPRPGAEMGVALIKRENLIEPVPVESLGSNAMRHLCCRCGQGFIIYNQGEYQSVEECIYHFGRLIKSKEYGEGIISKYKCCGERRESPGCQVAMMHVTAGTLISTDEGYVTTQPPPPDEDYTPCVYSLDCEMVYTTQGLQLARITVVDMKLNSVFESFVKPSHTIVDYNTRFSGLTAKDFVNVTTTINDIHTQLRSFIHNDTILIGHSLESDLKSMKLMHSTVVDTSIVYPHRNGPPYKRGLKDIMAEQLKKFIQDNVEGGHDSHEDAAACMELMVLKIKNDLQADSRRRST